MNTFMNDLQASIVRKNPELAEEVGKRSKVLRHLQPDSFDALLSILKQSKVSSSVQSAACWLVAQGNHRRASTALWNVLIGEDRDLIWESAKAISTLKTKSLTPRLISLLESESVEHRCAAAYTLGMMRESKATKYLEKMVIDRKESSRVRGHVAEALAYLRQRRSLPTLLKALNDPNPEVRWWSAFALGELGDKSALPALERAAAKDRGRLRNGLFVRHEARRACERLMPSNTQLPKRKNTRGVSR